MALLVWRDGAQRPVRFFVVSVVVGLCALMLVVGLQVAQGFAHARQVVEDRNQWLSQLAPGTQVAVDALQLSGKTVEVWTFERPVQADLDSFPGVVVVDPGQDSFVSPALSALINRDPVARRSFADTETLDDSGVADGAELFAIVTSGAVGQHPITGPAPEMRARSAAVDNLPLWLGLALVVIILLLPAAALIFSVTVVGGRQRRLRAGILIRHGSLSMVRATSIGEPMLMALPGAVLAVVGLQIALSSGMTQLLGVPVVAQVWQLGAYEALAAVVGSIALSGAAGALLHRRLGAPAQLSIHRRWRRFSRRGRSWSVVAAAVGMATLAASTWFAQGSLSLALWFLALAAWVLTVPGLLVAAGMGVGDRLRTSRRFALRLAGARLRHRPGTWVGRWVPLVLAALLLPPGLLAVTVLAESDPDLNQYVRVFRMDSYAQQPSDNEALRDAGADRNLLIANYSRTPRGLRIEIDCETVRRHLGVADCRAARRELTNTVQTNVQITATQRSKPPADRFLVVATGEATAAQRLAVAEIASMVPKPTVTELGPDVLAESAYLDWLLQGLAVALVTGTLATFLVLVDRSQTAPDARRLSRVGGSRRLCGAIEATTFSVGYSLALATGTVMGLVALWARLIVDPSTGPSGTALVSVLAGFLALGGLGTITAYFATSGALPSKRFPTPNDTTNH